MILIFLFCTVFDFNVSRTRKAAGVRNRGVVLPISLKTTSIIAIATITKRVQDPLVGVPYLKKQKKDDRVPPPPLTVAQKRKNIIARLKEALVHIRYLPVEEDQSI